jgi:glucosyl-dolichyl phosphate glucuronosyltransferase
MESMRLDVIIPTFNRCASLRRTLDSLLAAPVPAALEVMVTVVDNNSSDDTCELVSSYEHRFRGRLRYLFEGQQGKSSALNTGIRAATGDLVGMIDDDESVDPVWFATIEQWFRKDDVDFIGGPYRPDWETPAPAWLPDDYKGVIGANDTIPEVQTYGLDHPGMLPGGNAVIRRSLFDRVGLYSTALPRYEDDDMYRRLLSAGSRGKYVPELAIYHRIHATRLRKSYYRSWVFRLGVYLAHAQSRWPEAVPHVFGIPRYYYGRAVRSFTGLLGIAVTGKLDSAQVVSAELPWWNLAGLLYGRCFNQICFNQTRVERLEARGVAATRGAAKSRLATHAWQDALAHRRISRATHISISRYAGED